MRRQVSVFLLCADFECDVCARVDHMLTKEIILKLYCVDMCASRYSGGVFVRTCVCVCVAYVFSLHVSYRLQIDTNEKRSRDR